MKVKSFIISTAAKWFDIFVLLVFTVISVPIMLSKWNIETFGAWILLLGVMGYINTPILGIQEYIYGKNLKLGIKKKKNYFNKYNFKLAIYSINFSSAYFMFDYRS